MTATTLFENFEPMRIETTLFSTSIRPVEPAPADGAADPKGWWRLVWCHEHCHKRENVSRCQALRKELEDFSGSLVCVKKANQFLLWLQRAEKPPYVLVTDWREAQPCMQFLTVQEESVQPMSITVICDSKRQHGRAQLWASKLPPRLGSLIVMCERSSIPSSLLNGLVQQHFGQDTGDSVMWPAGTQRPKAPPGLGLTDETASTKSGGSAKESAGSADEAASAKSGSSAKEPAGSVDKTVSTKSDDSAKAVSASSSGPQRLPRPGRPRSGGAVVRQRSSPAVLSIKEPACSADETASTESGGSAEESAGCADETASTKNDGSAEDEGSASGQKEKKKAGVPPLNQIIQEFTIPETCQVSGPFALKSPLPEPSLWKAMHLFQEFHTHGELLHL